MSLFQSFAELNDALAATTKKLEKRALIASYLRSLPVEDAGRAALWLSGTPFPETDPRDLNVGGSLLSKAVAQLSAAPEHSLRAAYRRHGDLGAAAADLLQRREPSQTHNPDPTRPAPVLTLEQVDSALAALAAARGPQPKLRLLLDLLARATPVEAKYLIKLITGDMRTGVKQSLVEEAIADAWPPPGSDSPVKAPKASAPREGSPMAVPAGQAVRRASMLLGSLPEVVALAAAGRLDEARMKLFHPLGFMLASPVQTTEEAIARFTEEVVAEAAGGSTTSSAESESAAAIDANLPDKSRPASVPEPGLTPAAGRQMDPASVPEPALTPADPVWKAEDFAVVSGRDFSRADQSPEENGALAPETPRHVTQVPDTPTLAVIGCQLEDKYDGIRAQLHLGERADTHSVALYSRNREDLSASFPELVEAFAAIAESAILDGEILAWNPSTGRALSFSTLQQRLGRKRVTQEMLRDIPVVLVVFDILYRGETLLLNEPLARRRTILEDFAARWSPSTAATEPRGQSHLFAAAEQSFPRLILAPATHLGGPATGESRPSQSILGVTLDQAYTDARDRGNEGVMLKSLASLYLPGRRGLAWLKLKRELATLDVVVTGVEYGNGRRAHVLSDYTFAVRDVEAAPNDPDGQLRNVGKAYSGLTDQEITDMTAFFKAHTLEDNGHFRTVEPIVVLEVAFNNVMRSTRHASGFALRFPRILRIRTDKPVAEIDTLARVEEIYNSQPDKPIDQDN